MRSFYLPFIQFACCVVDYVVCIVIVVGLVLCYANVVSCAVTSFRCVSCSVRVSSIALSSIGLLFCVFVVLLWITVLILPFGVRGLLSVLTTVHLVIVFYCLSVLLTAAEVDTTVKLLTKLSPFTRFRATRRFVEDGLEPIRGKTLFPRAYPGYVLYIFSHLISRKSVPIRIKGG